MPRLDGARTLFILVAVCGLVLLALPADALAHAPHDEVRALILSPAYVLDGTIFVIIRYNILRSTDFGCTWHRLTRGLGPYSFVDLAISPAFAADRCLFAASNDGGIFRSTDAGLSWKAVNGGLADRRIASIQASPKFADDHRLAAVGCHGQLYATTDAGDVWRQICPENARISAVGIAEQALIVGTHAGTISLSEDLGLSWRKLPSVRGSPVTCFSPLEHSPGPTILAGTTNGALALTHAGGEWQVRHLDLAGRHVTSLASTHDERGRSVLFASTWHEALFRSDDGGASWTRHASGLTTERQADDPAFRCPHFKGIAISPGYRSDKTVFLGGFDGVFQSTDGGQSWRELRNALSIGLIVGFDLATVGDSTIRLGVTSYVAGVYSRDADGPWEVNTVGLPGGRLFDFAFSPSYRIDRTAFTVSSWTLFKSSDGGRHWDAMPLVSSSRNLVGFRTRAYWALRPLVRALKASISGASLARLRQWLIAKGVLVGIAQPGFGAMLAISPDFEADRTVFVGGALGVLRSRDGGKDFQYVLGPARAPVRGLVISPNFANDGTVFAALDGCLQRSRDGGTTWEVCHTGGALKAARLAISPAYAQDRTLFLAGLEGLWRSTDGGADWRSLTIGTCGAGAPIDGLAVSPSFDTDAELVVHVCGVGLFRSADGGKSFTPIPIVGASPSPALSHMTAFPDRTSLVRFSPHYRRDRTLYASSMEHLLRSPDGGTTWEVLDRPVRFENWCGEVSYRGKWRVLRDAAFSTGTASGASQPGSAAVLHFVGKQVRWIGMRGPRQGVARVMIDGELVGTVDQYAEIPAFSVTSFVSSDLAPGSHSISVEVTDAGRTRSPVADIVVDAFDVT